MANKSHSSNKYTIEIIAKSFVKQLFFKMVSLKRFIEALEAAPTSNEFNYVSIRKPPPRTSDHEAKFTFMKAFLLWYLEVLGVIYFKVENHINFFDWSIFKYYQVLSKLRSTEFVRYYTDMYIEVRYLKKKFKCENSPYGIEPRLVLGLSRLLESTCLSPPKRWHPMKLRQLCLPKAAKTKITDPETAIFLLKTFKFDKIINNRTIIYFSDAFFHHFLINYYNKYKSVKLETDYFDNLRPYCICAEGMRTKEHIKIEKKKRKASSDIFDNSVCALCNALNSEKCKEYFLNFQMNKKACFC